MHDDKIPPAVPEDTGDARTTSDAWLANLPLLERIRPRLTDEARRFLKYLESRRGLQERVAELMNEVYHPYPDPRAISSLYRKIVLQDVWVLHGMEGSAVYLEYLARIGLEAASRTDWPLTVREKITSSLLGFLVNESLEGSMPADLVRDFMQRTAQMLHSDLQLSYRMSRHLKRAWLKVTDPHIREVLEHAAREALGRSYGEWTSERMTALVSEFADILPELVSFLDRIRSYDAKEDPISQLPDHDDLAKELLRTISGARHLSLLHRIELFLSLFPLPPMEHFSQDILTRLTRELRRTPFTEDGEQAARLFELLFPFLEELPVRYYPVVTTILRTIGVAVMEKGTDSVVHDFSTRMAAMPFPGPHVEGITEDWQIRRHPAHLPMVRTYLEIIRVAPARATLLLAALHVNLRLHGVFISDTDLFQPDVSALLNADIAPVFKQVKQLCRLFPVFFKEIGAEGELRTCSTNIDEHFGRRDRLMHFFRKQIHIESNNTLIDFADRILETWADMDTTRLVEYLPEDVQEFLRQDPSYLESAHQAVDFLMQVTGSRSPAELMEQDHVELERLLKEAELDPRPAWLVRIRTLLVAKYDLAAEGARDALLTSRVLVRQDVETLFYLISTGRIKSAIHKALQLMDDLKEVILSPEKSVPEENIYRKRHIAAGIPSMYGTYWERKLDALGSMYRLENLVEALMNTVIQDMDFGYFTRRGLRTIKEVLDQFLEALKLDGIHIHDVLPYKYMLGALVEREGYSLHQYMNVFQMLSQRVAGIIERYFNEFHREAMTIILARHHDSEEQRSKTAERLLREIISDGFGVSQLDAFLGRILATLGDMRLKLDPVVGSRLLEYSPDAAIKSLEEVDDDFTVQNGVFLGNKGHNLWMLRKFGVNVPPAFIVTTEVYRHRQVMSAYPSVALGFRRNVWNHIAALEKVTDRMLGRVYEDRPPLLVSVRSGSAISMPGAMTTFLNIGLNDENVNDLAGLPNYGWTAWDCYRRMIQSWGMASGIERDEFDSIIAHMKKRLGVERKLELSPANMEALARQYRELLASHNVYIPDDPYEQVFEAVNMVFDSWDTSMAKAYRRQFDIAEDWGTAVIVQSMVLGNLNFDSGTGVAMTRTVGRDIELYGDYVMYSQGEDVVSGLVYPFPISEKERASRGGEHSLEKDFPGHYRKLQDIARLLILENDFPNQEIEFTFEDADPDNLYVLQTRTLVKGYKSVVPVFTFPPEPVAAGVPAGGGAYVGRIVLSREGIERLRQEGDPLILVRPDTVPDDVDMIFECGALLTARGGITSHAAVTAARIGRVAVVGCRDLVVDDSSGEIRFGKSVLREGDWLSIDGRTGFIYPGRLEVSTSGMAPDRAG